MRDFKVIYRGRILKLIAKTVRLPNRHVMKLEVILHPGAALIVPFLDKDRIIFLRQFRPVVNAYLFELPAGTIEGKESPLSCAKRELTEETGFSSDKFRLLGSVYPVPGYSTERIFIYRATELKKTQTAAEADEVINIRILNKHKAQKLFRDKKIVDAKSICALALCGWL